MAAQAKLADRFDQIGVVAGSVNIVTAEAGDAAAVHEALNEVVALHPIFVCGSIGKMREGGLTQLVFFKPPEIL